MLRWALLSRLRILWPHCASVFVVVFVPVVVRMFNRMCRYGHNQPPVLDAFKPDEPVGELANLRRPAMHDQHFKAGIVVEMCVARGDHHVVVSVLQFGQLLAYPGRVVVVDQRHRSDHNRIGRRGLLRLPAGRESDPETPRSDWYTPVARSTGQTASKDPSPAQSQSC